LVPSDNEAGERCGRGRRRWAGDCRAHGCGPWSVGAGFRMIRRYPRGWLPNDLVAGLVLTAFLVPVGMGYAQAAGLPPITGLYATIVPLLVYAVFGPSRVMVLGPDSSLAAVIAGIVLPLGGRDPARAVALAGMLAILTGS
jgi:MFS superfamily sulfate permease-like transporter